MPARRPAIRVAIRPTISTVPVPAKTPNMRWASTLRPPSQAIPPSA
jgi:hypothetical protein